MIYDFFESKPLIHKASIPRPTKNHLLFGIVKLLRAWIILSALIFAISFVVHLSTFLQIDTMEAIPGVMLIHVAIFPPFFAAIVYLNKLSRERGYTTRQVLMQTPFWMRLVCGTCFAYAFINFIIFGIQSRNGGPSKEDGKFFLTEHGRVIREISEAEFHQHQNYVVRGFSGHWLAGSSAAVIFLTGVARSRAELPIDHPSSINSILR